MQAKTTSAVANRIVFLLHGFTPRTRETCGNRAEERTPVSGTPDAKLQRAAGRLARFRRQSRIGFYLGFRKSTRPHGLQTRGYDDVK